MRDFLKGRGQRDIFIIYLMLLVAGAAITLTALLRIPTDSGSGWLLGFSRQRLAMIGGVFLAMALSTLLLLLTWRRAAWGEQLSAKLAGLLDRNIFYIPLAILSLAGVVTGAQLYHLTGILVDPSLKAYFSRLLPIIVWGSTISAQTLVFLPFLRYGKEIFKPYSRSDRTQSVVSVSAIVFGFFLLLWGCIALSGLGIIPDAVGWDEPGVPVLPSR